METPYKPCLTSFKDIEKPFEDYILKEKCKVNNDKLKTDIQENLAKWFEDF